MQNTASPVALVTLTRPKIRVLVVDDSALIRQIIVDYISATSDLTVVGVAADGLQAMQIMQRMEIDVVTLDIQMPRMDGLQTLDALLAIRPVPVLMVSSHTRQGADLTLEALERGAIDYVAKPDGTRTAEQTIKDELLRKIRAAADADFARIFEIRRRRAEMRRARRSTSGVAPRAAEEFASFASHLADKCIALGISTGGPPALASLFETLAPPLPPIVIVQHMPPKFTRQLAERLNAFGRLAVKEAETGDVLEPNHVYLAPGGQQLEIRRHGHSRQIAVFAGDPISGHRPSVDVMMRSAAHVFGARCLGIIMTGMGRDGSDGCKAIRAAGGYVLGQNEATSDVYGMNKVAMVEGHVDRQFALDDATVQIALQVRRLWSAPPTLTERSTAPQFSAAHTACDTPPA